jgi:hypothetical protein
MVASSLLLLLYRVSSLLPLLYRVSSLLPLFLVSQLQTGLPHFSTSLYCFLTSSRVSRFLHGSHYTVKDSLTFLFFRTVFPHCPLKFPSLLALYTVEGLLTTPRLVSYLVSTLPKKVSLLPPLCYKIFSLFPLLLTFRSQFFYRGLPFLGFPFFIKDFSLFLLLLSKAHFSLSRSGFFTYNF